MNSRKIDNEFIFEGKQVVIDGDANISYESLCRYCYKEEQKKYLEKRKTKKLNLERGI